MSIARSVVARCVAQLSEAKGDEANRARRHAKAMVRMLSDVIEDDLPRRQSRQANDFKHKAIGLDGNPANTQETCVNGHA